MSPRVLPCALLMFLLLTCSLRAQDAQNLQFFIGTRAFPMKNLIAARGDAMLPLRPEELPQTMGGSIQQTFGHIYIPLDDPDFAKLLQAMGGLYTWSSTGETLFIFSSGRNIYFDSAASWFSYRGREQKIGRGFIKKTGTTYIPLAELLNLMGVAVESHQTKAAFQLSPVLDDLLWKEDMGTREFLIHATCPLRCETVDSSPRHITLFFPDARSSLKAGEIALIDGKVKVEDAPQGQKITFFYPDNWEGRLMMGRITGDTVIELLPRFSLTPGYRCENFTAMKAQQEKNGYSLALEASGPMQYLWKYIPDQRLLILDIPLSQVPQELPKPVISSALVKEFRACSFEKGYGDTRFYFTLQEGAGVTFLTDKNAPHQLRLLFAAGVQVSDGRGVTGDPECWGTIVIDPGHGGCDPGAVSRDLGLTEKEVNLDVCRRLTRMLESSGWKVVLTHSTDRDVSWAYSPDRVELQARVDVGVANSATVFISVHCNASTNAAERGSSLHWSSDKDLPLAYAMTTATDYFTGTLGIPPRGLYQNSFYVVNHSPMPALLVEMAHLSNYEEACIFSNPACRQQLAEGIARGIERYFLEQGFKKRTVAR